MKSTGSNLYCYLRTLSMYFMQIFWHYKCSSHGHVCTLNFDISIIISVQAREVVVVAFLMDLGIDHKNLHVRSREGGYRVHFHICLASLDLRIFHIFTLSTNLKLLVKPRLLLT